MKILKGLVTAFALTAAANCLMASNAHAAANVFGHIVSMQGAASAVINSMNKVLPPPPPKTP